MSYRDDLEAAQARATAAEQRAQALQKQVDALRSDASADAPALPVPEHFTVASSPDQLRVTWRWFSLQPMHWVYLALFALVWDAITFAVFAAALWGASWVAVLLLGHVAAGVWVTHDALSGILNRTTVTATRGELRIAHGPVPSRGTRVIRRDDLEQLYVDEITGRKGGTTWELCALLAGGRKLRLIPRFTGRDQARYLERVLEGHFGIRDGAVADEAAK